jgi:hypothetical protein
MLIKWNQTNLFFKKCLMSNDTHIIYNLSQGLYTSKGQKIHNLFRVPRPFFSNSTIFLSTVMVLLKWPQPVINKSNMYCNYTASEIAIGSGMDWGLDFCTLYLCHELCTEWFPTSLVMLEGKGQIIGVKKNKICMLNKHLANFQNLIFKAPYEPCYQLQIYTANYQENQLLWQFSFMLKCC